MAYMNNVEDMQEKTIIKQIFLCFRPFGDVKIEFRISDIVVWTNDINHEYFLFDINTPIEDFKIDTFGFDYYVEIFSNKDITDNDIEILKNKCKQVVKNYLNRKIEFYNNNLKMFEENE